MSNKKNPYPGIMRHVTVVARTADEILRGEPGTRRNLCPLQLTQYDLDVRDVRPMNTEQRREWSICPLCLRVLAEQRS